MNIVEKASENSEVLLYCQKMKLYSHFYYDNLMLFMVKPGDIVKYIERQEDCGKWPFEYVCQIDSAINKITKECLIDFPELETQTEEDRVLSKLLKKNNFFAFGTNTFFKKGITANHVIAFMERDEIIYSWNGDFVLITQQEVKRVKAFLL